MKERNNPRCKANSPSKFVMRHNLEALAGGEVIVPCGCASCDNAPCQGLCIARNGRCAACKGLKFE